MALTPEEKRAKQAEKSRRWYEANKERVLEAQRQRRAENPEEARARAREYSRRWSEKNRGKDRDRARRQRAENPEYQRLWQAENREKQREYGRRYRAANRERVNAFGLRRVHGLLPEELAQIYEAQAGACYLCGDLLPGDRSAWRIDHDHRCSCGPRKSCRYCRRGIACDDCNVLIGRALDDPARLRRIADNLEAALADVTRRLASKAVQEELFELRELGGAL